MDALPSERPYRSHLQPACVPCRRRKSRCQNELNSTACLMCRAHNTECIFPSSATHSAAPRRRRGSRRRSTATLTSSQNRSTRSAEFIDQRTGSWAAPGSISVTDSSTRRLNDDLPQDQLNEGNELTLDSGDGQHLNMHIVGPSVTNDSHILSDYLSNIPGATRSTRSMGTGAPSRSRPVLFTMIQKAPVGVTVKSSPAAEKLEMVEKLLEPYKETLINLYFHKVNNCLPLLEEASFRRQLHHKENSISSALLACLYAHALTYWQYSPSLSSQRCPDSRFIWNLANEALYSELNLSPGVSTISAILLNIGGRPTTSLIGNGVLLGSAVSLAQSLGLNHSPMTWNIAQSEKHLRMKIWWSLVLHDKWMSLTHGTPPHISKDQHDVPPPQLSSFYSPKATRAQEEAASVFIALVGLTDVLDNFLQHIYLVAKDKKWTSSDLELKLNDWVESLNGDCRRIIIRGSLLNIPGAANLRLAYLTIRLLLQRIELEADRQGTAWSAENVTNRYTRARRTAEDVLLLTQELGPLQLGDFWLSVGAFTFPTTINFLLRCGLEGEQSASNLASTKSFRIARDLIDTLRRHQQDHGWDLADVCLAQHAEILDKLQAGVGPVDQVPSAGLDLANLLMPDASMIDQLFPSIWDPLQDAW